MSLPWVFVQMVWDRPFTDAEFAPVQCALDALPTVSSLVLNVRDDQRRAGLVQTVIRAPSREAAIQVVLTTVSAVLHRSPALHATVASSALADAPDLHR